MFYNSCPVISLKWREFIKLGIPLSSRLFIESRCTHEYMGGRNVLYIEGQGKWVSLVLHAKI